MHDQSKGLGKRKKHLVITKKQDERESMTYQNVEAGSVNRIRIISIIPDFTKRTEKQRRLSNLFTQFTQFSQYREFAGDMLGAISLFVMLFGGMWTLPIIAELVK